MSVEAIGSLLEHVASSENLYLAHKECSRGKRSGLGYQKFLFGCGERLLSIRQKLLNGTFTWQGYREFIVKDPKARVVMAAPFCDRVVHHAIHRVIEPIFDPLMSDAAYACRKSKGTSGAVLNLCAALQKRGTERYVVKLDVEKFFDSISHPIVLNAVFEELPDTSLRPVLAALVRQSHFEFGLKQKGIPIGNLTSQLFANWYLTPADQFIEHDFPRVQHFRYMDDFVLVADCKKDALDCAQAVVAFVKDKLELNIPFTKFMPLAADPVPFLGYLLHHTGYAVLARNRRRFEKHLRILRRRGCRESRIAQALLVHSAFTLIPKKAMNIELCK